MSTTEPRQDDKIKPDTCNNCIHCTHEVDEYGKYYYCEIDGEYIAEEYALDESIGCDLFVEKLDDHKTEEP